MTWPGEERIEGALSRSVDRLAARSHLPRWLALTLTVIALLALCVGIYRWRWGATPVKAPAGTVPVQTVGGAATPGGIAPPVRALARIPRRTVAREIRGTPASELPREERGYAPAVPPAAVSIPGSRLTVAFGRLPDNAAVPEPALLTSSVVPPSRGATEVRTWLLPDGNAVNVLTAKREPFFGWTPGSGSVGIGYGVGARRLIARGRWEPLRIGSVRVPVEVSAWTDPAGTVKGSAGVFAEYHFGGDGR